MNTIEVTAEQYAAHLAGESITIVPKVKQWVPRHPLSGYGLGVHGEDSKSMMDAAVKASQYIKLLAYVEEFGGDWMADLTDSDQNKWFVSWDIDTLMYLTDCDSDTNDLCKVYMSQACAKGLANKLESGEVVL